MNRQELENLIEDYNINIEDIKHVLNAINYGFLSCDFDYYLKHSKYYKVMLLLLELYSSKCNRYVNSQFINDEILDDFGITQEELDELL